MDSTAFHELIAQLRGARTALAKAEQKVTAVKGELAQQEHGAKLDATPTRAIKPLPKRVSGWQPVGRPNPR
jgi:hypothetical protein